MSTVPRENRFICKEINMKRWAIVLLVATGLGLVGWQSYGVPPQDTPSPDQLKLFMRQKLEHSKTVLEALSTENYQQLATSAQALSLLSLESNWNTITTPEYIEQSADFRRACQTIKSAAEEKNVDRAALGFVDLTVRCVECHKYLRRNALLPKKTR
ncbi:MAG: hypothetical protein R3C53_03675 [Pirellulaceae bacterium]